MYYILALISKTGEVYVHRTRQKDFHRVYKDLCFGTNLSARRIFDSAEEAPLLFLLEAVELTKQQAFGRCVVWSKLFEKAGYLVLDEALRRHMDSLHPSDLELYAELSKKDLRVLCDRTRAIAYVLPEPEKRKVVFEVSTDEYRQLKVEARSLAMSVGEYSKQKLQNGEVRCLNILELHLYRNQISRVEAMVETIIGQMMLSQSDRDDISALTNGLHEVQEHVGRLEAKIMSLLERENV